MRKFLIVVVVLGVLAGTACWAVQSPRCWEMLLKKTVKGPDLRVWDVAIKRVHWEKNGILIWTDSTIKFKFKDVSYFLSISDVRLESLFSVFSKEPHFTAAMSHVALVSNDLNISDLQAFATVNLSGTSFKQASGMVNIPAMDVNRYALTSVEVPFVTDARTLTVKDAHGAFYGGQMTMQITIDYVRPLAYIMRMDLAGVDLKLLAKTNPQVFGKTQGIIKGRVTAQGDLAHLEQFHADFDAVSGGQIKASLLGYLAQYVPQQKQLQELIQADASIPLDKAIVSVLSFTDETFTCRVQLLSNAVSLDMNVVTDVHVDGGIILLWKRWGEVSH